MNAAVVYLPPREGYDEWMNLGHGTKFWDRMMERYSDAEAARVIKDEVPW